ncbi:hypothetical protein [Flavobacterium caeni]|uniref:hypothetical protein n=1 Tax=Flavobacterium caeni TaxID=490189 RepID=UPI0011131B35|nr:hypothetical protein [Flavobacterium caeni]
MKLESATMLQRNYRIELQRQLNLLLDFMLDCDDVDQRGRLLNEIRAIRARIKPTEGKNAAQLSQRVHFRTITFKSALNGNSNNAKIIDTPNDQHPVAAA